MSIYDPPEPWWMDDDDDTEPIEDESLGRCIDCDSRRHRYCDPDRLPEPDTDKDLTHDLTESRNDRV